MNTITRDKKGWRHLSTDDAVRSGDWLGEVEAALETLRRLTKTARKEKRLKARDYLSDACDFVEEALRTERSPSPSGPSSATPREGAR